MQVLKIDELNLIHSEAKDKFKANKFFNTEDLSEKKSMLVDCMAFLSTALVFAKNSELQIRTAYKSNLKGEARQQVLKHKLADLWGLVLAFDKSFLLLEALLISSAGKNEKLAGLESLMRISFDTMSALERFNSDEIKSKDLSNSITYVSSLTKASDFRGLSKMAVDYLGHLA